MVVMMCVMQSRLISWVGVHSRPINMFRNVRFTWTFQAHPSFANTYHCFDHRMTFHQTLASRPIKSRISGLPRPFSVNYLHMLSKQYNHTSVVFPFANVLRGLSSTGGFGSQRFLRLLLYVVVPRDGFDEWMFFQLLRPAINATLDHFNPTLRYVIMLAGAFVCAQGSRAWPVFRVLLFTARYEVAVASRCLNVVPTVVTATTQNNVRSL